MKDNAPTTTHVINRQPVHPSITVEQISDLVEQFYGRVRMNERLGPIFEARVKGNWPVHLGKMKQFWSSVLLRSGEYKGKPVPAHVKLTEVQTDDFRIWLTLFRCTVEEVFSPEAQPLIVEAAERIATSLWMAMDNNPFNRPPDWSQGAT